MDIDVLSLFFFGTERSSFGNAMTISMGDCETLTEGPSAGGGLLGGCFRPNPRTNRVAEDSPKGLAECRKVGGEADTNRSTVRPRQKWSEKTIESMPD